MGIQPICFSSLSPHLCDVYKTSNSVLSDLKHKAWPSVLNPIKHLRVFLNSFENVGFFNDAFGENRLQNLAISLSKLKKFIKLSCLVYFRHELLMSF